MARTRKKRTDLGDIIQQAKVSQVGKLRDALVQEQMSHELTKKELELSQKETKFHSRQVQLHEKREKKRTDGLKKAQQSRKKGAKKNGTKRASK